MGFVGIDLARLPRNRSGAAALSAHGWLLRTSSNVGDGDQVVRLVLAGSPADMPRIVAIDAPLAVRNVFPHPAIVSLIHQGVHDTRRAGSYWKLLTDKPIIAWIPVICANAA